MIISAPTDYREAARRRLPPFLFHYIDGGAYAEHTLRRNVSDLADVALREDGAQVAARQLLHFGDDPVQGAGVATDGGSEEPEEARAEGDRDDDGARAERGGPRPPA